MKAGAEGGPFEISGTAEAGDGSRQFRFEVARLFPPLFRVVLFTSIAKFVGVCCCLILGCVRALLVKDGGIEVKRECIQVVYKGPQISDKATSKGKKPL